MTPSDRPLARRPFLLLAAGAALAPPVLAAPRADAASSWDDVRAQFALDRSAHHFATWLLASHPRPVRDAIARYRDALDRDPTVVYEWEQPRDEASRRAA